MQFCSIPQICLVIPTILKAPINSSSLVSCNRSWQSRYLQRTNLKQTYWSLFLPWLLSINLQQSCSCPIFMLNCPPGSWLKSIRRQVSTSETSSRPFWPQVTISLFRTRWICSDSALLFHGELLQCSYSIVALLLILLSFRYLSTTSSSRLSEARPWKLVLFKFK